MTPRCYILHTDSPNIQQTVDALEPYFNLVVIDNSKNRFELGSGPKLKKIGSGILVSPVELNWSQMMNWCQQEEMLVHRHSPDYYVTASRPVTDLTAARIAMLTDFIKNVHASELTTGLKWWKIAGKDFDVLNRSAMAKAPRWDQWTGPSFASLFMEEAMDDLEFVEINFDK